MNNISRDRISLISDYKTLRKQLKIIPKNLKSKMEGDVWTNEQAVRAYIWIKQGDKVPGLSEADSKDIVEYINSKPALKVFADQLRSIQKGDRYAEPNKTWLTGSITTDLLKGLETVKRSKYLEEWQANVDVIFSDKNLNKLEVIYGNKYRKAIENSLKRMKTGRNKSYSDDSLTSRFNEWLNGSIGVTMFFNTRSALLQTISAVNFINLSDNNPYKASKAFANQKQFWKDFRELFNSDFLVERRGGLKMSINESDIADVASKGGVRGVMNKLLQLGFTPTQIADSFAIAGGGSTFYRNRIKTYIKKGMSENEAKQQAFKDFRELAEESQQSSRPDKISQQQASPLGRMILAFGNTPAQYLRITDKAVRDLVNGRGDAKTHISKIIYYMTIQNVIFSSLQQALFAIDDDTDDDAIKDKYIRTINSMADSVLRGAGFAGVATSTVKNAIIKLYKETEKKRPNYEKAALELLKISPPISSKVSKLSSASRSFQWDLDEMQEKGLSLDNPAYLAGANVISASTNVPLDRVVKKINNIVMATENDLEFWERAALLGGWQDWELDIEQDKKDKKSQIKLFNQIKRTKIKPTIIK
jgi:hypothetical protein